MAAAHDGDGVLQGPDGFLDLVLKFRTEEIVSALLDQYESLARGDVLPLTLTGALTNQMPIEGTDFVVIKGE